MKSKLEVFFRFQWFPKEIDLTRWTEEHLEILKEQLDSEIIIHNPRDCYQCKRNIEMGIYFENNSLLCTVKISDFVNRQYNQVPSVIWQFFFDLENKYKTKIEMEKFLGG